MLKRRVDKGSPCLKPFSWLNSLVGDPLTNTETFIKLKTDIQIKNNWWIVII